MAFIGASFVNDIVINKKIGEYLMIGEEIGYFRLGSCIVSKLSNVMLDCRIKIDQEYYLETRQQIGRFIQDT